MLNFALSKMKQGEALEQGWTFFLIFALSKMKQGEALEQGWTFFLIFALSKNEKGEATKSLPAFADFCGSKKRQGEGFGKRIFYGLCAKKREFHNYGVVIGIFKARLHVCQIIYAHVRRV